MISRDRTPHLWLLLEETAVGLRATREEERSSWRLDDPLWRAASMEAIALHLEKIGMKRWAAALYEAASEAHRELETGPRSSHRRRRP
jgi:hypothetical protein